MAVTIRDAYTGQLAAAAATLYTTDTGVRARILKCTVTNDTTTSVTFILYKIPTGGTAGPTNMIINTKTLGSQESYTCPEVLGHCLDPGDFIQGVASAANQVTIFLSVVEIT
jgi:hypothetical protein